MIDSFTVADWQLFKLDYPDGDMTPEEYTWAVLAILVENGLWGEWIWSCHCGFVGGEG